MKFILLSVISILLIAKSQSVNPYFASCCAPDGTQCYDGTSSIDSNPSDPGFCDRKCYRLDCNYNWYGQGGDCQACHDACYDLKNPTVNIKYNEQCCAPDGTQCYNGLDLNDSDESNPGYCDRMCYRIVCKYNWEGQGGKCQACHDACHAKRR